MIIADSPEVAAQLRDSGVAVRTPTPVQSLIFSFSRYRSARAGVVGSLCLYFYMLVVCCFKSFKERKFTKTLCLGFYVTLLCFIPQGSTNLSISRELTSPPSRITNNSLVNNRAILLIINNAININ